ncbi:MAG: ATP synthase F0 subunit B [Clostridia bacterium]|nr:ATP synthase F0 subunit B [Clostridia bacterium]
MNIQISVIIWTVICFVALMLILRNLLFKPLLDVMDKRRERLENAEKKKAEMEKAVREHEKKIAEQQAQYLEHQKRNVAEKLAAIQAESKDAVIQARQKRITDVESFRIATVEECEKAINDVNVNAKNIAETFAKQVIAR